MDLLINEHKLYCNKGIGILTEISEHLKSAESASISLCVRLKRCYAQLQHVMSSLETVNVQIYNLCSPVNLQDCIDTHEDHLLLFERFLVNLGMQLENESRNLKYLKGKFVKINIPDCEYTICDIEEPECEHPAVSDDYLYDSSDDECERLVESPENCDYISRCDNCASEHLVEIPEHCDCISNSDLETFSYVVFKLKLCEYNNDVICKYLNISSYDTVRKTYWDVTVFQCHWKTLLCSYFPT